MSEDCWWLHIFSGNKEEFEEGAFGRLSKSLQKVSRPCHLVTRRYNCKTPKPAKLWSFWIDSVHLQDPQRKTQGQVSTSKGSRKAQGTDEVNAMMFGDPLCRWQWLVLSLSQGDLWCLSQAPFCHHPGVLGAGRGQGFSEDLWAAWTREEIFPPQDMGLEEFPHRGSESSGPYQSADIIFQCLALLFLLDRALQSASTWLFKRGEK